MENIIVAIILNISFFISMSELSNKKIDYKNIKFYFVFLFLLIAFLLNYKFSNELFRVLINSFICIILANIQFEKKLKKSVLLGVSIFILTVFAELIYSIISYPVLKYLLANYKDNIFFILFNNIIIVIILIFLSKLKPIKALYFSLVESIERIKEKAIIFLAFFLIIAFNVISLIFYYISNQSSDYSYLVLISSILTIVNGIIVYNYLKSTNKYLTIYEKYNISLDSIKQYEKFYDKSKIENHENKNQLLIIRNMSKNKQVIKYIDNLINNKIKDDEQLFIDVCRIPEGGLRGLVYSKLLLMKSCNISFELNIDKKLKSNQFKKMDDTLLVDLCKIIGVILDNAIEEVIKLDDKYITIEFYWEKNYTNISVTNNYKGYIDIDIISTPGYSTKKDGRGYGLTLVKELINKHDNLENKIELFEDNFMQTIKIKM